MFLLIIDKFLAPEYLLPIIAIIVSILSLRFSYRYNRKTLLLTKEHNRKSVEPILSPIYSLISEPYYIELGSVTIPRRKYEVVFELKNCGFGPAIIKSLLLIIDKTEYKDIFSLSDKYIGQSNYNNDLSLKHTFDNEVIASNEHTLVFKIHFNDEKYYQEFNELAKKISLKIIFDTIYKEERIFTINSLTV